MKTRTLLRFTLLFLVACSTADPDPLDNTVHLAGYLSTYVDNTSSFQTVASYWRDGQYTALTTTDTPSRVNSMNVDGPSVLIGGWKWFASSPVTPPQVVVWDDTRETVVPKASGSPMLIAADNDNMFGVWHESLTGWVLNKNGISQPFVDTARTIDPSSLAVGRGVAYVAGSAEFIHGSNPVVHELRAQCWKNGEPIFRESLNSNALAIFIHEDDIYLAGHHYVNGLPESTACYWKNSQRVDLTDGSGPAIAKSIFVSEDHVYVAGMIDRQAVYWIDGSAVFLTTEGNSMAHSIAVRGSDVHVGGHIDGHPAYWKNGIRQTIANQDEFGEIEFVMVGGN